MILLTMENMFHAKVSDPLGRVLKDMCHREPTFLDFKNKEEKVLFYVKMISGPSVLSFGTVLVYASH